MTWNSPITGIAEASKLKPESGRLVAHSVPSWNRIEGWLLDLSQLQQELPSSEVLT